MDHLMRLYGDHSDPVNSGSYRSYFLFYKWEVEGEVHFDLTNEDKTQHFKDLGPGDRLWFSMDNALVGYINVLRVEEDPTRDTWEIWYDGFLCHKYTFNELDPTFDGAWTVIPLDMVSRWLEHCT